MKPGDYVVVKQGVRDPDFNSSIEAWQGRVIDLCENEDGSTLLAIEWDSQTLSKIPEEVLLLSVRSGLDWALMYLLEDEVQITKQRDTSKEVKQAQEKICEKEMKIIEEDGQKQLNIIAQVTQNREAEDLEMLERQLHDWRIYLEKNLSFPFEAEIIEPSILDEEELKTLNVIGINDANPGDGILVKALLDGKELLLPLSELMPSDPKDPPYSAILAFHMWFDEEMDEEMDDDMEDEI